MTIKFSGAQVTASSTPGQADGTISLQLDIGRVANTDIVSTALKGLPAIEHPANILGDLALITSILAAIQQHSGAR